MTSQQLGKTCKYDITNTYDVINNSFNWILIKTNRILIDINFSFLLQVYFAKVCNMKPNTKCFSNSDTFSTNYPFFLNLKRDYDFLSKIQQFCSKRWDTDYIFETAILQ